MRGQVADIARQFTVFCGVGVINTAFGLAIIFGLTFAGVNYMIANAVGYGFGLFLAFMLHKKISFRDGGALSQSLGQFRKFLVVFAISYGIQFFCLIAMVDGLGINAVFAQTVAVGIYTVVNYTGNRVLTFRKRP